MTDKNQLIVNHSSGLPERIVVDFDDPVLVSRARFERLLAVAASAYTETYEAIIAASRKLQPGDLDPIP